jgi:hypothetical protein
MSEVSLVNDVSIAQLRVLSVVGLLVTAVMTTALTMLAVSAGAALARGVRQALNRHREGRDSRRELGPTARLDRAGVGAVTRERPGSPPLKY